MLLMNLKTNGEQEPLNFVAILCCLIDGIYSPATRLILITPYRRAPAAFFQGSGLYDDVYRRSSPTLPDTDRKVKFFAAYAAKLQYK